MLVAIDSLKPAPWNPRSLTDKKFISLCKSVASDPEFMELRPILATADGTIYAGHMRWRACKELGMEEVHAVLTDITKLQAKERSIKDNNSWGEWDDSLASLLDELENNAVEIETLGMDKNIGAILENIATDILEPPKPTKDPCPTCGK